MALHPTLIAINVGNCRTQIGLFDKGTLDREQHFANDDQAGCVKQIVTWWKSITDSSPASIVLASVNEEVAKNLSSEVEDRLTVEVYRVGDDLPLPIGRQLDPETITGVDRLLNAAAAYDTLKEACIVVDAGTAITVDFVDGEGTFQGGAIAPGARLQLKALHDSTDALPDIEFTRPDQDAFGRSTSQAMLKGVYQGIRGMVWKLVEQYAEVYGAYPLVIATGGDAETLFHDDELIDRIVPNLTLDGIMVTAKVAMASEVDEDVKKN